MINGKKQNNLNHKFLYNSLIFGIYSEKQTADWQIFF